MAERQDEVRIPIYINDEQAKSAFKNLRAEAEKYRKAMHEAQASGDLGLAKKMEKELKGVEKQIGNLKKINFDVNKVLNNLSEASKNDLIRTRKELEKHQSTLRRSSKEYEAYGNKIKAVRGELNKMNNELVQQKSFASRASDGFNKYFGIMTAVAASFTGVVFGAKKMVESFNEFESKVSELSAITGLAGADLKWLSDQAKELSISTDENGIKITQSATDIVEAYKLMGSARPELLKNKEDLNEVTKQALILAEAAKMELAPAIEAVAGSMNQFNLPATEAANVINVLAAGALEGSAEIDDLTASMKNVGAVADDSNMSLEQTVAALEVLASKQLKGEEAGTKLRGALLKMKQAGLGYASGQFVMADAMEEANKQIAAQGSAAERDALKIKYFGAENVTAGTILLENIDTYKSLTVAVTGTNEAIRQAQINTENNAASLKQAQNRAQLTAIAFGEKLAPAMTFSTNGVTMFLKVLMATIEFISRNIKVILTVTTAIVAYNIAIKLSSISLKENMLLTKLDVFWKKAQQASLILVAAAQALFTGNLQKATAAMRLFNMVTKLNPFVLLVSILAAAGTALYLYTKRLSSAEKAQKALVDVNVEAQKSIAAEKVELEKLMRVAQNEKLSKEQRLEAIKKLNEISPKYLGGLTLETINTDAAKVATEAYIKALERKATVQAATNLMTQIEEERLAAKASGDDKKLSFWDKAGVAARGFFMSAKEFEKEVEKQRTKNAEISEEDYKAQMKAIADLTAANTDFTPDNKTESPIVDAIVTPEGTAPTGDNIIKARETMLTKLAALNASNPELASLIPPIELADAQIKGWESKWGELLEKKQQIWEQYNLDEATAEEVRDYWIGETEALHIQGLLSEEEYQQALLAINKEYLGLKLEDLKGYFAMAQAMTQMGSEIVNNIQAAEFEDLEARRDKGLVDEKQYEAESLKIKKKYADAQFVLALAQIVANTAQSIMATWAGYASFGPFGTAAAIAQSVLLGGIGITQGVLATKQRQRVKQLAKGKYDVIGMDDNQSYSANYTNSLPTGLTKHPTLVGEEPEVVWSTQDTRQILTYNPMLVAASRNPQGYDVIPRVNQRAAGKYPDNASSTTSIDASAMMAVAAEFKQAVNQLQKGVPAFFNDAATRDITSQQKLDESLLKKTSWK